MTPELDQYTHIYGDLGQHPLAQTMRDVVERHGESLISRAHYSTSLASKGWAGTVQLEEALASDLLYDIEAMARMMRDEYAAVFGPNVQLVGHHETTMDAGHVVVIDWDNFDGQPTFEDIAPGELALPKRATFDESGYAEAAQAYRRACGWDFSPGGDGVWITYNLLTDGSGGSEEMHYNAHLVGFVILYDRDGDGEYESLAHMWTAKAARRKGVASRLLEAARARGVTNVEGPLTEESDPFFMSRWPEIFTPAREEHAVEEPNF